MYLDGCPPELGCSVTLRGGNSFILSKVKQIMQYMVYMAYSLRLETHFLLDEFAMPSDPKTLITVDKEEEEEEEEEEEDIQRVNEDETASSGTEDMNKVSHGNKKRSDKNTAVIPEIHEDRHVRAFQNALDHTYLTSSPYVRYPLPYLLTSYGRQSVVRFALPKCIYWSARLDPDGDSRPLSEEQLEGLDSSSAKQKKISKDVHVLSPHPFVLASLTLHCSTNIVQALLADFRAQGGTVQLARNGIVPLRSSCKWIDGLDEIQRKPGKVSKQKMNETPLNQPGRADSQENNFVPVTSLHSNHKVLYVV